VLAVAAGSGPGLEVSLEAKEASYDIASETARGGCHAAHQGFVRSRLGDKVRS